MSVVVGGQTHNLAVVEVRRMPNNLLLTLQLPLGNGNSEESKPYRLLHARIFHPICSSSPRPRCAYMVQSIWR